MNESVWMCFMNGFIFGFSVTDETTNHIDF